VSDAASAGVDGIVAVVTLAVESLTSVVEGDWSVRAGSVEWSCWQTVDHMVDCVFSYTLQLAGRAQDGWLALQELHALPSATPGQLVQALGAVGETFAAVLRATPAGVTASDGVQQLDLSDWAARAMYEVVLHTYDVLEGLGGSFEPPPQLCAAILASPALWAIDRDRAANAANPWEALLVASGRPKPAD
jgi:hypothetical protein